MKKALLFLLLLVSANSFAQIHRVAVYDFGTPSSLTPAITPSTENGGIVKTTNTVFKNGQTYISFQAGSQPMGSEYMTIIRNGQTSYSLRVYATTTMTFGCNGDSKLDSIRISDLSTIGDLHLADKQPGYQDGYQGYKFWKNDEGKNTTKVSFFNSAQASELQQISVYYTTPSEILIPTSNISSGSTINNFESLKLTFDRNISQASSRKFTMSHGGSSLDLNISIFENVVTLTPKQKIEEDGSYTISIPAKTFKDVEGFENKALTYTFTVKVPKNTFTFLSVNPTEGTYQKLPLEYVLNYDNAIGGVEKTDLYVTKNGKDFCSLLVEKTSDKTVTLKMANQEKEITAKGTYQIIVPEKTIFDMMKGNTSREHYNPAFTLTYVIDDSETMKQAKNLLNARGVGYPTENSEARKALAALVNAEEVPTDDELKVAINNFYKEADVTMPSTGKYYKIAAANSNGKRLYLHYDGNKVGLTTNYNDATAFYATHNENGTLSFQTPSDDKFLHVLTNISDVYDGTSSKNVTADATSNVKDLTWKKFYQEGNEEKTFGLFSFHGLLGRGGDGVEVSTYASVDFNKVAINSTPGSTNLRFDETVSTAFELTETEKPAEAIKTVETAYSITPSIVSNNQQTLTLTFPQVDKITLADDAEVYFTSQTSSEVVAKAQLTASGDNSFIIALSNLQKGKYAIVMKEGAFHYILNGNDVKTQAIRSNFEIGKNGSGEDTGINYDLKRFKLIPDAANIIKDTDFNEFYICVNKGNISDLIPDPNMEVRIAKYSNNTTIRSGRLVRIERDDMPNYYVLKLKFDNPIQEGELRKDDYAIVLLAGTFGDANFGQYLQDKTSISPSLCHANDRMTFTYTVDNDAATGMSEITFGQDKKDIIYDLMGRRITQMTQPGIYIVNGKKVIKK